MWRVALLVCMVGPLSGCLGGVEASEGPRETTYAVERLLVRAFVEDGVIHIRMGGVTPQPAVVPFAADLEVMLVADARRPEWNHRVVLGRADPATFATDGPLPYTELVVRAPFLRYGDMVHVFAEATLDDGRVVQGTYKAYV